MICVNNVKHIQPMTFVDKELYEKHRITCYSYTAPRVVFVSESTEEGGSGSSSGSHQLSGRGRRGGSQPHTGFSRDDMKRHSAA